MYGSHPSLDGARCPECGGVLAVQHHPRLELERCTNCGGTWFDRRELASLLDHSLQGRALDAHDATSDEPTTHRCPRCDAQTLSRCRRQGIECLKCPGCGGMFLSQASLTALGAPGGDLASRIASGAALEALAWFVQALS